MVAKIIFDSCDDVYQALSVTPEESEPSFDSGEDVMGNCLVPSP